VMPLAGQGASADKRAMSNRAYFAGGLVEGEEGQGMTAPSGDFMIPRTEFAAPQSAVNRLSVNVQNVSPQAQSQPAPRAITPPKEPDIHTHVWFSEEAMARYISQSPRLRHQILKVATEERHMIVGRG
jgi:hypothetical protein